MLAVGVVLFAALMVVSLIVGFALAPILLPLAFVGSLATQPYQAIPPGMVPSIAMPAPAGPLLTDGSALMTAIQPWVGTRYLMGGNGPPQNVVDCSGFSLAIIRQVYGVTLGRTAQAQFNQTARTSTPQPGDLVFFSGTYASPDFITHVGVYIGDGMMESAIEPTLGRQSLNSPYWVSHFAGYGQVRR